MDCTRALRLPVGRGIDGHTRSLAAFSAAQKAIQPPGISAAWVPFPVLSAVLGAAICRDMPLYAAICRSLEPKLLIVLRLGFFFEPEGRGLRATLRVAKPSQPKAARESLPARQLL